jgi:hypothetical protein
MTKTVIITGIPRSGLQIASKFLSGQMGWMPEQERRFPRTTMFSNKGHSPLSLVETEPMVFTQDPTYLYEWEVIHKLYPNACWMIVRRDQYSLVESCKKTGWIDYCGESDLYWNAWYEINMKILNRVKETVNHYEIWPCKCLSGSMEDITGAIKHFKLREVE